jgi:hypothetical protein
MPFRLGGKRFRHETEYDYLCHLQAVVSVLFSVWWFQLDLNLYLFASSQISIFISFLYHLGWNSSQIQSTWFGDITANGNNKETSGRDVTFSGCTFASESYSGTSWQDIGLNAFDTILMCLQRSITWLGGKSINDSPMSYLASVSTKKIRPHLNRYDMAILYWIFCSMGNKCHLECYECTQYLLNLLKKSTN